MAFVCEIITQSIYEKNRFGVLVTEYNVEKNIMRLFFAEYITVNQYFVLFALNISKNVSTMYIP